VTEPRARVRVVVVEDEPQARACLREYIRDVDWLELVGEAGSGPEGMALIDRLTPSLVFLDVCLPDMTGLEVIQRIRHSPDIVFTTAHDRFALAAFEVGAIDYLLKPFGPQRFQAMLARVRTRLAAAAVPGAERARHALAFPLRRLFARTGDRIVPIPVERIRRVQAQGDYIEVHCASGVFLLHMALGELASRLDPESFLQVHRSHLVNLAAVKAMHVFDERRLLLELDGGDQVLASRSASEQLRRWIR
jgi:two-component system LytT family response regulator